MSLCCCNDFESLVRHTLGRQQAAARRTRPCSHRCQLSLEGAVPNLCQPACLSGQCIWLSVQCVWLSGQCICFGGQCIWLSGQCTWRCGQCIGLPTVLHPLLQLGRVLCSVYICLKPDLVSRSQGLPVTAYTRASFLLPAVWFAWE